MTRRRFGDVVVECSRGDITDQADVDAIVNAANAQLAPGGGVAGAIHAKAGPGLYEECKPLAPITTGQAVITSGHALANPWCIHALGPVYEASSDPAGELAATYRSILECAEANGIRSIASPAISTGVFGYPAGEAARVALGTVASEAVGLRSVRLFRSVLWDESDLWIHTEVLEGL